MLQGQGAGSSATEEQWDEGSKKEPCTGELASNANSRRTAVLSEGLKDRRTDAMMEEKRLQGSSRSSSEIVKVENLTEVESGPGRLPGTGEQLGKGTGKK